MDNHRSGKDLVKRTEKLEKELSAKNHELEIEAALEKVRTVAMRMNKPGDVPDVCKTLYKQFLLLGFGEMRNAMVNIHNDADKSFINYDYSDEIGKSTNQLTYNIHPLVEKQIKKIRSANDAFSETYFSGEDLVEWRKFRKRIGEKNDPRLRKTKGLYYYFYSIGTGSIGISTFGPISKEKKALLKRFRNVFNLSYQRYIDIAKAEAQAREAQIQLALERVRARTMAMQKSDELPETAAILFEQFKSLGQELMQMTIGIVNEADGVIEFSVTDWSGSGAGVHRAFNLSIEEPTLIKKMYTGWKENRKSIVVDLTGKDLENWISYRNKMSGVTVNSADTGGRRVITSAFFSKGHLSFSTPVLPVDGSIQLLERFAQVFDLTYTRFLDLQKAEAQARESQIQLALERVRARTMAMQKSDELAEAARVLYEEFRTLNINTFLCGYCFYKEEQDKQTIWVTFPDGTIIPDFIDFPITGDHILNKRYEDWKQKKPLHVLEIKGEENKKHHRFLASKVSDQAANEIFAQIPDRIIVYGANFSTGYLFIIATELLTGEEEDVIIRFAKVFELTYTRFNDLKQAEAQARESQIQLALERVRARTMAMQKSDELMEASNLLLQQVQSLGIPVWACGYNIWEPGEKVCTAWMSVLGAIQPSFRLPLTEHRTFIHMYESRLKAEASYVEEVSGEELADHYRYMFSLPDFREIATKQLQGSSFPLPQSQAHHVFNFKHGNLIFLSAEALPEARDIFKRFTAVFEQTYTRFLDLQKAEAQAREAKIEAALENVRSRSLAMHHSNELKEVVKKVFEKMKDLGFFQNNSVMIVLPKNGFKDVLHWTFNEHFETMEYNIPAFNHSVSTDSYKAWERGEKTCEIKLNKEEKDDFLYQIFTYTDYSKVPDEFKKHLYSTEAYNSFEVFENHCGLLVDTFTSVNYSEDQKDVVKRFAKVFEQAYIRFLDLQKAEAQARQAQIEASLERVRASAMAMHRSDELSNVLAILFEQFDVLKIQPVDVHLDLFDLEKNTFSYRATGKEGKRVIAEQIVDLGSRPEWQALLEKWKKGKPNTVDFSYYPKEVIRELMAFFPDIWAAMPGDAIMSPEDFPDGIFDALGFCKFGYIGFHHHRKATEEEQKILIRFANEFERLYQRFLDLQKAEAQAREAQIELGLERVRARAMAMQKSDELKELVGTVYNELTKLDLVFDRCLIWVMNSEDLSSRLWMANAESQPVNFYIPHHDNPPYLAFVKAWKDRNKKWQYDLHGQVKKEWDGYVFNQTEMKHLPGPVKKNMRAIDRVMFAASFHNFGCLQTAGPEPLKEEQFDILNRFAKVFDLTYTRFNDLKQAEAQAREAQIELGLERVRARAMAMQKSDELSELVDTVFKELTKLDFALTWCIINIIDEPSMSNMVWAANPDIDKAPDSYHMKFEDYPFHHAMMKGWKERKTKYVYVLEGTEKKIYDKYLFNETEFRKVPQAAQAASSAMEKYVVSFSFSNFGGLQTVGDVPLSDANLDILSRFGKVFDLTYTRFNDLKQAEAQARESQIQLALERVRARTMAMQKSDEMTDVAGLLFEQVSALGIKTWTAGFNVWSEDNNSYVDYITSPQGGFIEPYTVYTETAEALTDISNARKSGVEFDVQYVEGEKIKQLYLALTKLDEKQYEIMLHDGVRFPSHQYEHFVFGSKVSLMFITYEPVPEAHDIFKRLGKVFEQTYTRFLDLQKAEAQAREAQIEAALERVRSRSMGMQKSEELKEVIQVVYEQFVHLNIYIEHTGFIMDYKARDDMNIWLADKHEVPFQVTIPYFDCAHWNSFNEAKQKGKDFFANKLSFEEKNQFYRDLFKLIPGVPDETKEYYFSCPGLAISTVLLENVGLYIENFSGIAYSDEENNTLMRFGKVFQQTYTRFLDLQKAEAQAREAKIETALEKVRSRTMAMQHSDELGDVAEILFKQVKELGIHPWSTGFNIWKEGNDAYIDWITNPSGGFVEPYTVDLTTHPFFREISDAKKRGEDFHVFEISGEPLRETYALLMSFAPKQFEGFMALGFSFPTRQFNHYVFGAQVSLMFITHEPYPEAHDIFKRFGKVFEQTYTRFLDLQKAEAQARESQIEAALERVRSRTMGMQRSTDLQDTASILFSQVQALGALSFACGFNIWDGDRKAATAWMAREDGIAPPFKTSSTEDVFFHIHEAAQRGESLFVREQGGDELETHYRYMATIPVFKEVAEKMAESGVSFPSFQIMHCAFFSQGYLMFITYQPVPRAHDIFKRFAKVFEQTYTRFLDLQKAEAQALEAIKRASVDRVRAEIASMRTTNDLERITPLIWNELTTLGVPFIRCGVFIMDGEKEQIETHLSTPDGESIAAFKLPYNAPGETAEILAHWHKKELYKQHWDEKQFVEFTQNLVQQGAVTSGEKYLTENRPTDLYLHFLPFLQGMLYVGNTKPLSDDALQLVQNLADAFSTAYARYEDFNKLEAAKKQVDSTLNELQATQKQLIQSEKMASLGELTAGIAHEIQNPLNFVNNFSDVNKELLEELKEEADKGNIEEIKAIANDVINNEEKINHHGKRADAIVKNMLQHSRSSGAMKELTDINKLADEYLRLSYHGLRAKDKSFNADFKTEFDESIAKINIIPQDIGRVLLNLINNAFYATNEKKKTAGENYKPLVSVQTKKINNNIEIAVTDNGKGIPASIKEKIFQPFFTTKPTGQGTGLGLSLSYDIIKAHGGEIKVETTEGEGSEFIIQLPVV